jgi:hypothetical protein
VKYIQDRKRVKESKRLGNNLQKGTKRRRERLRGGEKRLRGGE